MLTLREVSYGLYGAWRLARLDGNAMKWFDRSVGGVLRSFWAAAICYPGFVLLLAMRADPEQIEGHGLVRIILVESIGYVIIWTAYPLMALPFCRWLANEERAFGFVIAYNWAQVLQMAVLLPIAGLSALNIASAEAGVYAEVLTYLALLVYEWFIARIALGAGGLPATALVLLDVLLGAMLGQVTQALY
jgi:hypothetical protein